jgi:hypothetical protein
MLVISCCALLWAECIITPFSPLLPSGVIGRNSRGREGGSTSSRGASSRTCCSQGHWWVKASGGGGSSGGIRGGSQARCRACHSGTWSFHSTLSVCRREGRRGSLACWLGWVGRGLVLECVFFFLVIAIVLSLPTISHSLTFASVSHGRFGCGRRGRGGCRRCCTRGGKDCS